MSSRNWLIGGLAAFGCLLVGVPAAAIATYAITDARGVVTVESAPDGSERTVHWRDYPGSADVDSQEVLAGPSLEEGIDDGEAMVREIREALSAEFGLEWAPPPAGQSTADQLFPAENHYGGPSMLSVVNAPTSQSTSVPETWEEKQRVIEIIGDITARYGYGPPQLAQDSSPLTEQDRIRDLGGPTPATQVIVSGMSLGPTGQWLAFTFQDFSKDSDGRMRERFAGSTANGWQANTITLSYGANGLLAEQDRAEFLERLEPYTGLQRPDPQIS
ncbi:hypothetical protein ACEXQD_06795 [Herbiconiux sp. P15]|uniref:hypothetical protein n=1 Tax=Herbiconiux liukaitaii TaxID=3342799 RepID=UPI0035B77BE0